MKDRQAEVLLHLIAHALALSRPRFLGASLDSMFQHQRDVEAIADVIAVSFADFDRQAFVRRAGWNGNDPMPPPLGGRTEGEQSDERDTGTTPTAGGGEKEKMA